MNKILVLIYIYRGLNADFFLKEGTWKS